MFSAFGFWVFRVLGFRVLGFRARRLVNNKTLAPRSFLSMAACLFGYYLKSILTLETIGCRNVSLWSLMVASGQTWPEKSQDFPTFFLAKLAMSDTRCIQMLQSHPLTCFTFWLVPVPWGFRKESMVTGGPGGLEAVWFRSVEIRRVCRIGSRFWLFVWRLQRQQLKPSRPSRANWSNGERLYQNHPVRNT